MSTIDKIVNNNIKLSEEVVSIEEKIFAQLIDFFAKVNNITLLIIFALCFKTIVLLSLVIVYKISNLLRQLK